MKIRQYPNIPILRSEIGWNKDVWQNSMVFISWKSDCWPIIKTKPPLRKHRCALYWSPSSARKIDRVLEIVFLCFYICIVSVNVYVCEMYISVIAAYPIFICVWAILRSYLNLLAEALECQIKSDLWKYPTGLQQRSVYVWKVSLPEKYLNNGPVKWDWTKRPPKSRVWLPEKLIS